LRDALDVTHDWVTGDTCDIGQLISMPGADRRFELDRFRRLWSLVRVHLKSAA